MVLEVSNRIRDIAEQGAYEGTSLSAKALREFVNQIDTIAKPILLLLPRPNTGWQTESGASRHVSTLSYDMVWYVRKIADNPVLSHTELEIYEELVTNVYLSRPQLQLNDTGLGGIFGRINLQTTSNLFVPIFYPPSGVPINQVASPYWGFIQRLTLEYRKIVQFYPQG